jgi:hypothetical protein
MPLHSPITSSLCTRDSMHYSSIIFHQIFSKLNTFTLHILSLHVTQCTILPSYFTIFSKLNTLNFY